MRPSLIALCLAAVTVVLVIHGYSPIEVVMLVAGCSMGLSVVLIAVIAALAEAPRDVWIDARNELRRCTREMLF